MLNLFSIRTLGAGVACGAMMMAGGQASAALLAIDSVTLDGSDALLTATVGGVAYNGGVIADDAEDNRGVGFGHPTAAGSAAPVGTVVTASGDQALAYDNSVLTGNAGSTGNANQNGGVLVLRWGAGFLATDNDADPDFFLFEDLGNDTVEVQAILADGTVGEAITVGAYGIVSTSGVLGTNGTGGNLSGRSVAGTSFQLTDLLDASGNPLTNGTNVQGIVIGDQGAADIYEVYANIDITDIPVPEPSSLALIGLGGLAMLRRQG